MSAILRSSSRKMMLVATVGTPLVACFAILSLPQIAHRLFSSAFLPHVYCYLNNWNLILLHTISDGLIWLSYVSISLTLMYLVYRTRREIPFSWLFVAFGIFIIACGFTHLMEMIVLWQPVYWLAGAVKVITAIASVVTAIALPPQVSAVHRMVMAAELSEDRRLQLEKNNEELLGTNRQLRGEITKREAAEESLQHLSGKLLQAQDDERRRFARELHDSVGQLLTGAALSVSAVRRQKRPLKPKESQLLAECADSVKQSLREIRTIAYLLHPPMLDETGLADALRWYVRGFAERSGVQVKLDVGSDLDRLSQDLRTALFRIVQEALTNVHRHSGSQSAEISLHECGAYIQLQVRDYGKGLPFDFGGRNGHDKLMQSVGIRGMQERVAQFKGEMQIRGDALGTVLDVVFPLGEQLCREATAP
jgi:signal transduction histidine kinase